MLRKPFLPIMLVTFFLCALLFLSACDSQGPAPPPPDGEPATTAVAVYYLKASPTDFYLVREVHEIASGDEMEVAALEELIQGEPLTAGAYRVLPADAIVLGLEVEDGLATVDFSREILDANVGAAGEALGIQSIVNTLTEFPGIEQVMFLVEGDLDEVAQDWWGHVSLADQPFQRDLSMVWEPAIWTTAPQPEQQVESPLTIQGSARVYEATVNLRLLDADGTVLAESFTTATAGGPDRGDFATVMSFPAPTGADGTLEVFWISPEDGSEQDKVIIPLNF